MNAPRVADDAIAALLLGLLESSEFANALRRNGKPCRIRLPNDPESRAGLVRAHMLGEPATLTFHADGREPWQERVERLVLAAFCPTVDGLCRWLAIDLDAADHGEGGLADPVHAMRAIAERAANAGFDSGLLAARSRGGRGRHLYLILPEPVLLADAVVGVAALAAAAFRVAASDMSECDAHHAFRRADGAVARPGDAGAVELIPRSTMRPRCGWALAIPAAGAYQAHGGGVIVDPFTDQPVSLTTIPRCDPAAWSRLVDEVRVRLARVKPARVRPPTSLPPDDSGPRNSHDRIDFRTREFLEGWVAEGGRNTAAFAASANLLGCGVEPDEAEALILQGARACGLPEREAQAAFHSAAKARARGRRSR